MGGEMNMLSTWLSLIIWNYPKISNAIKSYYLSSTAHTYTQEHSQPHTLKSLQWQYKMELLYFTNEKTSSKMIDLPEATHML